MDNRMGPGSTGGTSRHGGLSISRTIGFGAGVPALLHPVKSTSVAASVDTSLRIVPSFLFELALPLGAVRDDLLGHLLGGISALVVVGRRLLPRRGLLRLLAAVAKERQQGRQCRGSSNEPRQERGQEPPSFRRRTTSSATRLTSSSLSGGATSGWYVGTGTGTNCGHGP
jgi:hypothetical protein